MVMKIAIINPWAISNKAIGGTERFVIDLAEALKKLGNEVDVYMFSGKNHQANGVNYININFFDLDEEANEYTFQERLGDFSDPYEYKKLALELEKRIDGKKYDVIQLNSQLFLEAWKDCKRIFTIHTNPFEYKLAFGEKAFTTMLNVMETLKDNELTKFVIPSQYYAQEYKQLTALNNIYYIPHAIDIERLICLSTREQIEEKYKLNHNKINVLLPSRLEPIQKQPKLFIEACSDINSKMKKEMQIIYTGLDTQYQKYVEEMNQMSNYYKLDTKILRFDQISEAYKIADLCVLPSKSESFGYSALESLCLGITTILNNIPTFNEISNGNKQAILFDGTKQDLKNKLEYVIQNNIGYKRKIDNKWNKKYNLLEFGKEYINIM